ncbi:MAG: hypothetical protein WAM11_08590 [Cyanobium sp.]
MTSACSPWLSASWRRPRRGLGVGCGRTGLLLAVGFTLACLGQPAMAQVESFMLKPGSNVGPATKIKPTNCVTAADGSVTCDTKIENSPSDTPAKPSYQPFKN